MFWFKWWNIPKSPKPRKVRPTTYRKTMQQKGWFCHFFQWVRIQEFPSFVFTCGLNIFVRSFKVISRLFFIKIISLLTTELRYPFSVDTSLVVYIFLIKYVSRVVYGCNDMARWRNTSSLDTRIPIYTTFYL